MYLKKKRAVTIIELLVVLSIISILAGLLLPAVSAAREAARKAQCQNNLRQIGLALINYETSYKILPSGATGVDRGAWLPAILPYLEMTSLHSKYDLNAAFTSQQNMNIVTTPLAIMRCPSDAGASFKMIESHRSVFVGSYFPCSGIAPELIEFLVTQNQYSVSNINGVRTVFFQNENLHWFPTRYSEITDGLSNTILLGEVHHLSVSRIRIHLGHPDPYIDLAASPYDPRSILKLHGAVHPSLVWPGPDWNVTNGSGGDAEFYSEHLGRSIHFLKADGSVSQFSPKSTSLPVIVKMLGINDAQIPSE